MENTWSCIHSIALEKQYDIRLTTMKAPMAKPPFLGAADGWKMYLEMCFVHARQAVWSFLPQHINKSMDLIYLSHLGVEGCPSAPLLSAAVFEVDMSVRTLLQQSPTLPDDDASTIFNENVPQHSQWIFTCMNWLLTSQAFYHFTCKYILGSWGACDFWALHPENIYSSVICRIIFTCRGLELILEFSWPKDKDSGQIASPLLELTQTDRVSLSHTYTL